MSDQNRDYAAIRHNIEQGVARQKWNYRIIFFAFHLIFYLGTMLFVWLTVAANSQLRDVLFNSGSGASAIVLVPTIMWALLILCHGAALYIETPAAEKTMRQQLLMRELGEEMLQKGLADTGMTEKPKRRAEHSALSDDGELIPADEDEDVGQRDYDARTNRVSSS